MSYVEKMDVIDLIIETLKEHEKALDDIIFKIDALLIGDKTKEPGRTNIPSRGTSPENWR